MAYTKLTYHICFSTKERRPWLRGEVLDRLCHYLGGVVRKADAQMLVAGGHDDHVHMLLTTRPTTCIADLMRATKANSSRWLKQTFDGLGTFAWQDGYGAFSVSPSVLPEVVRYIENQQEHHRRMTFQEEFLGLLQRHGVEYDPEYIWR